MWDVKHVYGVTDEGKDAIFETNFDSVPVVIADMQTTNGDDPAMLRFYNKNRDSIRFIIAEENSKLLSYPTHKPEQVGYIAIAKGEVSGLKAVIETDKDSCSTAPCTITFDGSKSTGDIVSYEWDFGDGSTANGVQVTHTFNEEGTYEVKLTVTDSSDNTDTATKTITVGTPSVKGTVIKPGQSIKIKEKLLGLTPGKYELGLNVKYTDLFGASDKQVTEWKKTVVEVASIESDKFHVKLKVQEQNFCVGPNGLFGLTGKAALPKVRFSWKFVGNGAIKIDECDKKESDDFIYCDPTQFAIELAQKLNKIDELARSKKYAEIKNYTSFKAYLIADNYSENFQKDFAQYYTQGFLEAPSWFTSSSTPWYKYFENPSHLRFEPREIEGGLYAVTIDFNFQGSEYDFFKEGMPNATITVKFEKLHDVSVDVLDSPFYYMPFNGLVGASGRADYGIGFTNTTEPIVINIINNTPINTSAKGGKKQITTHLYREFEDILRAQSRVLEIDLANTTMNFYISQPMPVIMGIKSRNNLAEGFYQIYGTDTALGADKNTIAYWTGIAASPNLKCGDFYGYELPYKEPDVSASSLAESCAELQNNMPAFGFQWKNVVNNESLFLSTVFYTPPNRHMSIANACTASSCILASPSGLSRSTAEPLSLDSTTYVEKLQDVIKLIEQEYICVVPQQGNMPAQQNTYVFFWNEQKLNEQLESAKKRIAEEWNFNWENYECK
jgi:PKD repeat protein